MNSSQNSTGGGKCRRSVWSRRLNILGIVLIFGALVMVSMRSFVVESFNDARHKSFMAPAGKMFAPDAGHFYFAAVSDTGARNEPVERIMNEIRKSKARFVLYVGDLVRYRNPSHFQWMAEEIDEKLDHPKIKVLLNTDYASLENKESFERVFYSGPIDEYFGYELGELPYRSLRFDFVEYEREHFQSNSVINYPENHDFTRIGEYKYFLNDKSENTVVSFEYPEAFERGRNDRYYPIVRDENQNLYNRYLEKAKELKNVYFLGRLGDYKYYDMDKAVNRALALFDEVFAKKEKNNAA